MVFEEIPRNTTQNYIVTLSLEPTTKEEPLPYACQLLIKADTKSSYTNSVLSIFIYKLCYTKKNMVTKNIQPISIQMANFQKIYFVYFFFYTLSIVITYTAI